MHNSFTKSTAFEAVMNRRGLKAILMKMVLVFAAVACSLLLCGCSLSDEPISVKNAPDKLNEAFKEIPDCRMSIEEDSHGSYLIYDGKSLVGSVVLDEDDQSFAIKTDGTETTAELQRVSYAVLAAVLACNPDYEYSDAQDVAYEIIMAETEGHRDNGINYISGHVGDQGVLIVEL